MCKGGGRRSPDRDSSLLATLSHSLLNGPHLPTMTDLRVLCRPLLPAFTRALWVPVTSKPCLPLKDLCHLVLVEDEAGVVVSQDSHNAQAQAGSVAAHQVRGFEKQLGLNNTQLVQELAEWG